LFHLAAGRWRDVATGGADQARSDQLKDRGLAGATGTDDAVEFRRELDADSVEKPPTTDRETMRSIFMIGNCAAKPGRLASKDETGVTFHTFADDTGMTPAPAPIRPPSGTHAPENAVGRLDTVVVVGESAVARAARR
jgi:hypothetical protein